MAREVFVDIEFLAEIDQDAYLILIDKKDLHQLVEFSQDDLVLRRWDAIEKKVTILGDYGEDSVKTAADNSLANNLSCLPQLKETVLRKLIED